MNVVASFLLASVAMVVVVVMKLVWAYESEITKDNSRIKEKASNWTPEFMGKNEGVEFFISPVMSSRTLRERLLRALADSTLVSVRPVSSLIFYVWLR